MRIVFSTDWYSEGMGYSENVLPQVLSRMGHEVYVVSSTLQVYGDHDFYENVYGKFLGASIVEPGIKIINGVTVIRLPIILWWKRLKIARGRTRAILNLKPDIVFAWDPRSYQTVLLSLTSIFSSYKLFSAVHTVASVYPAYYHFNSMNIMQKLRLRLFDTFIGWVSSLRIEMCYANTKDAAEIASKFFGVNSKKVKFIPSSLDTNHFHPVIDDNDKSEKEYVRASLGFSNESILCIYSGRFTKDKNPNCLAEAIKILRSNGYNYNGIFLGEGEQFELISSTEGCLVKSFIKYEELPKYYRAADIGVWPRQESISMSDASSCGIPIVVSNLMSAKDRIDGNGVTYLENDPIDLARVLLDLKSKEVRLKLGIIGSKKIIENYSLDLIAKEYILNFQKSLN
jgi:glycosyltransferase involved in cell wall biosynthesis